MELSAFYITARLVLFIVLVPAVFASGSMGGFGIASGHFTDGQSLHQRATPFFTQFLRMKKESLVWLGSKCSHGYWGGG
jgi:hypothetical protein